LLYICSFTGRCQSLSVTVRLDQARQP